jgi:hypothetical protein
VRWLGLNIKPNGIGLGEGGFVGCSILAECFCPLLPNPCYTLARLISKMFNWNTKPFSFLF